MKYLKTVIVPFFLYFNSIFAQCPRAKLIQPCECYHSLFPAVICNKIYEVNSLVEAIDRSANDQFEWFGLSESVIMYLPAKAVSSKNITVLVVAHSTMASLFNTAPDAGNFLEAINLINLRIQRGVRWELFKNFKRLDIFKAENTAIKSLGRSFVENINLDLTSLTLKNTKLKRLHPNAFQKLEKLGELAITNCFVTELKRSMFSTPSVLSFIDFSGNQIESLPADIFSGMPKLESISLNDNKIASVSEAVFRNAYGNFHSIYLQNNPLRCDCSLKWFLNKEHQRIDGKCDFPVDKKGKELRDLTAVDFDYCK